MFGHWLKSEDPPPAPSDSQEILLRVREHLPRADPETVRVVTAMGGLLAAVAYADRDYSQAEEQFVRQLLGRVEGMSEPGIDAICAAMRRHVVEVSTVKIPHYTRELRELGDLELRLQVLDALVDLAAADGQVTTAETNLVRQITSALGLSQSDYNAAQTKQRERLSVLKG